MLPIVAVPDSFELPKFAPFIVTVVPAVEGELFLSTIEIAEESYENRLEPVPTTLPNVRPMYCMIPVPGGLRHFSAVLAVQDELEQYVLPNLIVGL